MLLNFDVLLAYGRERRSQRTTGGTGGDRGRLLQWQSNVHRSLNTLDHVRVTVQRLGLSAWWPDVHRVRLCSCCCLRSRCFRPATIHLLRCSKVRAQIKPIVDGLLPVGIRLLSVVFIKVGFRWLMIRVDLLHIGMGWRTITRGRRLSWWSLLLGCGNSRTTRLLRVDYCRHWL